MAIQLLKGAYSDPTTIIIDVVDDKFTYSEEPWENAGFPEPGEKSINEENNNEKEEVAVAHK